MFAARSSRIPKPPPLTRDEIHELFHDVAGSASATHITFAQLRDKLDAVQEELAPAPGKPDLEAGNDLHAILADLLPGIHSTKEAVDPCMRRDIDATFQISKEDFVTEVSGWDIPSIDQSATNAKEEQEAAIAYERRMPLRRRIAAHWSVEGPTCLFTAFVISLQIGFGLWQGLVYVTNQPIRHALGWGLIVAKFSTGALYPTLFFMILSMSRWITTWLRRSYHISRFINADFHRSFHIRMSIVALLLATLHAIGHLTGTFLYSSRPAHRDDLIAAGKPFRSYSTYIATLPGWTGLLSLGIFWLIALLSTPRMRRWNFEVFQLGHLLMFPMIGFLAAHGTAKLFQGPMLGYWLGFPTIVVLLERLHRLYRSLCPIPARLEVLDDETVCVTARHPKGKHWRYNAGQYILLQIPQLSYFQFHPFTISACVEDCLQVHIKTDEGNWTAALRELALQVGSGADVNVSIDGPFGAPAQRFYDYQKSIIVGSGIGVTPFAGILTNLEQKSLQGGISPWRQRPMPCLSRALGCVTSFPSQVLLHARLRSASRLCNDPLAQRRRSSLLSADSIREALSRRRSDDGQTTVADSADGDIFAEKVCPPTTTTTAAAAAAAASAASAAAAAAAVTIDLKAQRRIDFIWLVRDRTHLRWFSALLNRVTDLAGHHRRQREIAARRGQEVSAHPDALPVDLRVNTFITARRKDISTHVFRVLLDRYRSETSPVSALTGLRIESNFGRPDFEAILGNFYEDVVLAEAFRGNVGVFFCGAPVIGRVLADQCAELTTRAWKDKVDVSFHFLMEVFG